MASNCTEFLNLGPRNAEFVSRCRQAATLVQNSEGEMVPLGEFDANSELKGFDHCCEPIVLTQWQVYLSDAGVVFRNKIGK